MRWLIMVTASLATMLQLSVAPASAQSRIALVIANTAYQGAPPLATTVPDAVLIAETLQSAGYDVTAVSDVTKANIGMAIRTLLDKVAAAGPNTIVFFYFAGYGAQSNAESFLVPVDAQIDTADAIASEALPLSAVINALTALPAVGRIVVVDGARDHGFGRAAGQPVPPGLALIGAPPDTLIAYSAAPGAIAFDGAGPNSPFAAALATLMRQPGLDMEQIFKGVRLQVNQASNGMQTPSMVSALNVEIKLFEAPVPDSSAPGAEANAAAPPHTLAPALGVAGIAVPPRTPRRITKEAMSRLSPDDAYRVAIEKDSLETYQWFVEQHPHHSFASQVWDIITGRRQDILWRRARAIGSPQAYWNYLERYPDGSHRWEAQRWLNARGVPLPPPGYQPKYEALPPGYYDEAVGVVEVMPRGFGRPFAVFDQRPPIFLPPPPPRQNQPVVINVQPPPPAPTQPVNNPPVVTPRVAAPQQQPVAPAVNPQASTPLETPEQRQAKAAAIKAWQDNVRRSNEEFARKYKTPVVPPPSPSAALGQPPASATNQPVTIPMRPATPEQLKKIETMRKQFGAPAPTATTRPPAAAATTNPQAAPASAPARQPFMDFNSQNPPPGTSQTTPKQQQAVPAPSAQPKQLTIPPSGAPAPKQQQAVPAPSAQPKQLTIPPSASPAPKQQQAVPAPPAQPKQLTIPPNASPAPTQQQAIPAPSAQPKQLTIPPQASPPPRQQQAIPAPSVQQPKQLAIPQASPPQRQQQAIPAPAVQQPKQLTIPPQAQPPRQQHAIPAPSVQQPKQLAIPSKSNSPPARAAVPPPQHAAPPPPQQRAAPPAQKSIAPPARAAVPPPQRAVPPPQQRAAPPAQKAIAPPARAAVPPPQRAVPPPQQRAAPPAQKAIAPPARAAVPPPQRAAPPPQPRQPQQRAAPPPPQQRRANTPPQQRQPQQRAAPPPQQRTTPPPQQRRANTPPQQRQPQQRAAPPQQRTAPPPQQRRANTPTQQRQPQQRAASPQQRQPQQRQPQQRPQQQRSQAPRQKSGCPAGTRMQNGACR